MSITFGGFVTLQLVVLVVWTAGAGAVCPQRYCLNYCKSGYRVDDSGCKTCSCVDPCERNNCPSNQVCKSTPSICVKYPCYPNARCVASCPKLSCATCQSGYLKDTNGCPTCECVNRCERVKCPAGQVCKEVQIPCIRTILCLNYAKCVPK